MFPDPPADPDNVAAIKERLHVFQGKLDRDYYEQQAQHHDEVAAVAKRRGERGKAHRARESAKSWRRDQKYAELEAKELKDMLKRISETWGVE